MKTVISIVLVLIFSACSSVQETYKPLYQAEPERKNIELDKR